MPDFTRRARTTPRRHGETSTSLSTDPSMSNSEALDALAGANSEQEKEQVVVYLTQNSVTHEKDEIPETLASLKDADVRGEGRKSMIPISDPYSDGHKTDQYAFGESTAAKMTWWHDDSSLSTGQVRTGGEVLTLGALEDREQTADELATVATGWKKALGAVGLSADRANQVVAALLLDEQGKAKLTDSGAGASNELLQLISVLNRAENGEFDISMLVLSGHHYAGESALFGEVPGGDHEYDDNEVTGDTLDMRDIEALATVFPKAYSQIDSVMFSACNTHDMATTDASGQEISTPEWVASVFPNAERLGLWEKIAPGSDFAAFWSGEFVRDVSAEEQGANTAFSDAQFRGWSKGNNRRFEKNADGVMEEIQTKKKAGGYPYNDYKGLRNETHVAFHKREDLMKYILKKR